ncbi:MAG: hypothetical protein AABX83_03845 [Nanoarchaeota archaeon]
MERKEKKKKTKEKVEETKEKISRNNPIYTILIVFAILIIVFFSFYYLFSSLGKFKYEGITFTKEKFGEIPIFHYYYYITPEIKYNLYLRNDPRGNLVPFTGKAIEIFKLDTVYISINPEELTQCEYGRVGIGTLASFLADNQFIVKGATQNETLAKEANVDYVTCESNPGDVVISLQAGDKTEVIHESLNCYKINIAECEVLPAIEKFQVQMILDAKERNEEKKTS